MALTKERKVFLGVLLVAGGSLLVDRGILSSPKGVGAAVVDQITSAVGGADLSADTLVNAESGADLSMITSLVQERLGNSSAEPNPEHVASLFFPVVQQDADDESVVAASSTSVSLPRLTAIMPGAKGKGAAVLDGQAVRVGGETHQGFVLVRVVDRSAVLKRNDREYVVTLPVFGRSNGS